MNRQSKRDSKVVCIADLQIEGTKKLPRHIGEFYNEGSMDLITLRDNVAAFDRFRLRPRVGRDVTTVDSSVKIWGSTSPLPFGFSPTAMHKLAHPEGEVATSTAAARAGVPMILSHYSNTSIEDVVKTGEGYGNAYAMQLCMVTDWDTNIGILRRAERAGCKAFIVTMDTASLGRRLNEYRNNFTLPEDLDFPNMPEGVDVHNMVQDDPRMTYNKAGTWDVIKKFIASTHLDVFLKGILTAEDALEALETGAKGIIVSNHGGRQLDTAVSAIDALPEVVQAIGGRIQVHLDSGVRRGSDIFKALALGADFCWLGRAAIWGIAYNGAEGAELALRLLEDELRTTMSLCGCAKIEDISLSHLGRLDANGQFKAIQYDMPSVPLPNAAVEHTEDFKVSQLVRG